MTYFSAGTITSFTVTTSGNYNIVAAGAQGGIERGEHNVAVVNLEKIAIALEMPIKDLLKK